MTGHWDEITLGEAAGLLGCTGSNLRHAIKRGALQARKVGRDWLVDRDEVYRYKRDHKRKEV